MNVKPLADRVLVEALEAAEKTAGGIYITDNAKVGDVILYGKYSGTEVTVDGKEYLIMRESDILAVI